MYYDGGSNGTKEQEGKGIEEPNHNLKFCFFNLMVGIWVFI